MTPLSTGQRVVHRLSPTTPLAPLGRLAGRYETSFANNPPDQADPVFTGCRHEHGRIRRRHGCGRRLRYSVITYKSCQSWFTFAFRLTGPVHAPVSTGRPKIVSVCAISSASRSQLWLPIAMYRRTRAGLGDLAGGALSR